MKKITFLSLVLVLITLTSCSSVRVAADYDRDVNFNEFNSFAFFRPGIDKAEISDLDKKRILRAIDNELSAKGMTKSESPTLLVSIFTKERERVDVYNNNFGWGWGWNPWWFGNNWGTSVQTSTEGTLYIDLIDAESKELVWQGIGSTHLNYRNIDKKEEKIREVVREILMQYPPALTTN